MSKYYTFILFAFIALSSCGTKKKLDQSASKEAYRFAFYNVENLFDTVDEPIKIDEEYLPEGKKKWTVERYEKKLAQLAKVVDGMDYPALIGVCEVENATVLKDFIDKTSLSTKAYDFIHYDSPDMRGIDVAFLYQKKLFEPTHSEIISIPFPDSIAADYTSRDILYVAGNFKGQAIHFFVNHWPSRRGGVEASEPKRCWVAKYLKHKTDSIFNASVEASIFITGDFNDEPTNNSITQILKVASESPKKLPANTLYNCTYALDEQGKGTYNYRGNWNMIDQFIVSCNTLNGSSALEVGELHIFKEDWMLYTDRKTGQKRPSRTHSGPRYYGGYSDHLPIYIDVFIK